MATTAPLLLNALPLTAARLPSGVVKANWQKNVLEHLLSIPVDDTPIGSHNMNRMTAAYQQLAQSLLDDPAITAQDMHKPANSTLKNQLKEYFDIATIAAEAYEQQITNVHLDTAGRERYTIARNEDDEDLEIGCLLALLPLDLFKLNKRDQTEIDNYTKQNGYESRSSEALHKSLVTLVLKLGQKILKNKGATRMGVRETRAVEATNKEQGKVEAAAASEKWAGDKAAAKRKGLGIKHTRGKKSKKVDEEDSDDEGDEENGENGGKGKRSKKAEFDFSAGEDALTKSLLQAISTPQPQQSININLPPELFQFQGLRPPQSFPPAPQALVAAAVAQRIVCPDCQAGNNSTNVNVQGFVDCWQCGLKLT